VLSPVKFAVAIGTLPGWHFVIGRQSEWAEGWNDEGEGFASGAGEGWRKLPTLGKHAPPLSRDTHKPNLLAHIHQICYTISRLNAPPGQMHHRSENTKNLIFK
jgi:hypothetical protein